MPVVRPQSPDFPLQFRTVCADVKPEPYPWYALRVKSNCERAASCSLCGQGYEEFLPTYQSQRRGKNGRRDIQLPMFPGYVFCRLDIQNRLPILKTPGVVHIVGFGNNFIPLAEHEIETVRTIVNSELTGAPWPFLQVGQQVRIVRGPLEGIEGIILRFKNSFRLIVSVTLLQRSVAVEIDGSWARPIGRVPRMQPVSSVGLAVSKIA